MNIQPFYIVIVLLVLAALYAHRSIVKAGKSLGSASADMHYHEGVHNLDMMSTYSAIASGILLFLAGYSFDRWSQEWTINLCLFGIIAFFFATMTNPNPKSRYIHQILTKYNRQDK